MTSTIAQPPGADAPGGSLCAPVQTQPLSTLKARKDFLAAARAKRAHKPGFVLQARQRRSEEPDPTSMRIGYSLKPVDGQLAELVRETVRSGDHIAA